MVQPSRVYLSKISRTNPEHGQVHDDTSLNTDSVYLVLIFDFQIYVPSDSS